MPRLSAEPIELNELERKELKRLLKRPSTPQQIALRAKIVLRANKQESHGEIAKELGISKKMSRLWRQRWRELTARQVPVVERLLDIPMKPGRCAKHEFEYVRHGTQTLIASFNVATGAIALATVEDTRTEKDFEAHVNHLLQQFPQAPKYHLVMDCLNTHQSEALVRLVAKLESDS